MALTPRASWAGWRASHASSSPTGAMALSGTKWKASGDTTCDATSLARSSRAAGAFSSRGRCVWCVKRSSCRGRRRKYRRLPEERRSMRNILAIAQKELKSYFASPIAYIVMGTFAFLYGWFYVNLLLFFVRQSMQMGQLGGPGQSVNINQFMNRNLIQNVTILVLFLIPAITMRTYSEEKRSGTIE